MASSAIIVREDASPPSGLSGEATTYSGSLRLAIIDRIEPGMGIVAVNGDDAGDHMLQRGEIAVYDERWRQSNDQLSPGLYCLEHQRFPHSMPAHVAARLISGGETVRMEITRKVVFVNRWPKKEGLWSYRSLQDSSKLRLTRHLDGPYYAQSLYDLLLGPVVGIYRPQLGGLN